MGANGNATADLAAACNGQFACNYLVSVYRLGDPYPGWSKDFLGKWTCPGDSLPRTTYALPEASGSTLAFSCQVFNTASVYPLGDVIRGHLSSQYDPVVVHRPGWSSYVMFRCQNTNPGGVYRDRIWRSEAWGDGTSGFADDRIVVSGDSEEAQDDLSCAPGVVSTDTGPLGTWHMYYLTAKRTTPCNLQIFHAVADHPGLVWQKRGQVDGITLPPGECIGPPSPVLVGNQIWLYYVKENAAGIKRLYKASSADGHSFGVSQEVGSLIPNVCGGRVTYDSDRYWFSYAREADSCNSSQPTDLFLSVRIGDDNFQDGTAVLHLGGTFYGAAVGVAQYHPGDTTRGDLPRIYFAGNPGPLCPCDCAKADVCTCPTECSNYQTTIGIVRGGREAPQAPSETSYFLKTAASNEVLTGWPVENVIDRNSGSVYSSVYHATEANDTGVHVAAWRPLFTDGVFGPALVNAVRLTPRYSNLAFPLAYNLYLTTPTNSDWVLVGTYTNQPSPAGSPVTIDLPQMQGTWGVLLWPTQLGVDDWQSHYLQLAEMELLLKR